MALCKGRLRSLDDFCRLHLSAQPRVSAKTAEHAPLRQSRKLPCASGHACGFNRFQFSSTAQPDKTRWVRTFSKPHHGLKSPIDALSVYHTVSLALTRPAGHLNSSNVPERAA